MLTSPCSVCITDVIRGGLSDMAEVTKDARDYLRRCLDSPPDALDGFMAWAKGLLSSAGPVSTGVSLADRLPQLHYLVDAPGQGRSLR